MKYIALLRGINVGGNNKVAMSKLKEVFERMGYSDVSTYINSGNVIFESNTKDLSQLLKDIQVGLKNEFGFEISCVVLDEDSLKKSLKLIPADYQNNDEQKTDVIFLNEKYTNSSVLDLIKINQDVDNLKYIDGAIVWNIKRENYGRSGMNKFIGTEVYKNMTARNINTVRKLVDLLAR